MKLLLLITAVLEAATGLAFFVMSAVAVSMLLGVELDTPAGLVAGAALVALSIACWQARNGESGSPAMSVIAAMLFYNFAVGLILVYAGVRIGLYSALLWPAIVVHQLLGVWCLIVLWVAARTIQQR